MPANIVGTVAPTLLDPPAAPASVPAAAPPTAVGVGETWSIEVSGAAPERLAGERGLETLRGLFGALIEALDLHPVADPVWHVFGGPHAGVTGIVALSESHLACHTFPEYGGLTLDLYTCKRREAPDWSRVLTPYLAADGAEIAVQVHVRARSLGGSER